MTAVEQDRYGVDDVVLVDELDAGIGKSEVRLKRLLRPQPQFLFAASG